MDYTKEKEAAWALYEAGSEEEALNILRNIPRDKEVSSMLFQMRCDDQAKGIVSNVNPETEKYFEDLAKRLGLRKVEDMEDVVEEGRYDGED